MPDLGPAEIIAELERCRRKLLDLSLRNRMLNFRPSKVRGVEVVDEYPAEVFRILVREQDKMTFAGRRKPNSSQLDTRETPEEEVLEPMEIDPSDTKLNTNILEEHLHIRLLRIFGDARTLLQEQGINTLFLALGMLEWYESDASQGPRLAPLILVPVTLERQGAERFKLSYTGEDFGTNLSLLAKLHAEFGLGLPELPDAEELDVDGYFNAVANKVATLARWKVRRDAIHLGFFAYAKFLMYRDLAPENWQGDQGALKNQIASALLGDGFEPQASGLTESDFLDKHRTPANSHEVVNADSSQVLALHDAGAGRNFVIEGPPGTGKSQTITNIIAEAIAAKKRVLFVAEKMAALEVVKRFLDRVEIGVACLELHSHKARRRDVLEELQKTLHLHPPSNHDDTAKLAQLARLRERLNLYVQALHDPIGQTGVTPYQALGCLVRLDSGRRNLPRTDIGEVASLEREDYERRRMSVSELQGVIARIGVPVKHPFFGCEPIGLLRTDVTELVRELGAAEVATRSYVEAGLHLAIRLKLPEPDSLSQMDEVCRVAGFVHSAPPDVVHIDASDPQWRKQEDVIRGAIEAGRRLNRLHSEYDTIINPNGWDADVQTTRRSLVAHGGKWYRIAIAPFRRARRSLAELCRDQPPRSRRDRIAILDAIIAAQEARRTIRSAAGSGSYLFRSLWRSEASPWEELKRLLAWVLELHQHVDSAELPREILVFFTDRPSLAGIDTTVERIRVARATHITAWDRLVSRLNPVGDLSRLLTGDSSLKGMGGILLRWSAQPERVVEIVTYSRLRSACRDAGLPSVCDLADTWDEAGSDLVAAVDTTRFEELLRRARTERGALESFDGASHQRAITDFCSVDEQVLNLNRARVAHAHSSSIPTATNVGNMGVLLGEMNRKRGHMPIRKLMSKCWAPIQAIKPVFMMSPLSVAMFLPPDGPQFDVVIFDEASQVRPEDAFGAILRGSQLVVVGDSKQMPPTSFFLRLVEGEDDEEEEEVATAGDMESVLSLMRARAAPARWLRWHYRSRHHSLFAVSNKCFYDRKLLVFPSPETANDGRGLALHHLPNTVYGRGQSRANADEAKAIADAVLQHVDTTPNLTLGIAAFSQAQQDAIQLELERLRRTHPALVAFESSHTHEPLFVKNLENVQGDERDVVLISVGYGRDPSGVLSHNFGPLNGEGGERRLNVLMTRARNSCRVFTNFLAQDIDPRRSSARGVAVLKEFLQYAETGELDTPVPSGREADSEFEEAVQVALEAEGYEIARQVGSLEFFIDLAVIDASHPGRYVIGIECDGAKYHSARSARDRDRLREAILRARGWRLHRIWSTDWFDNPQQELRRAVAAIEAAKAAVQDPPVPSPPNRPDTSAPVVRREVSRSNQAEDLSNVTAYRIAQLTISLGASALHEVPLKQFAGWVRDVVQVESPVHAEEVLRRIREAADVQRAGTRIRKAFARAVAFLRQQELIRCAGAFLWLPTTADAAIRDRGDFPPTYKKLEYIAPEELRGAIIHVVSRSYGVSLDELVGEVLRLFGFSRVTSELFEPVESLVRLLIVRGTLSETAGGIALSQSESV